MVKKITNRTELRKELLREVDSLFSHEATSIIDLLEEKGYIDIKEPKYNIIVPQPHKKGELDKDIYSKEIGFVSFSDCKVIDEDYQFTQEEIDNNPVLEKLEPFKVEVK